MAEPERSKADAAGVPPARRREELEELLKRIANHIAEADQGPSAGSGSGARSSSGETASAEPTVEPPAPSPSSPAQPIGDADSRPRAAEPAQEASWLNTTDVGVRAIVAPPAAPLPARPGRHTPSEAKSEPLPADAPGPSAKGTDEPPMTLPPSSDLAPRDEAEAPRAPPSAPARRIPSAVEPPALRSALTEPAALHADASPVASQQAYAVPPAMSGDESWDRGSIDPRARPFEVGAAVPPLRSMLDEMAAAPRGRPAGPRDPEPVRTRGGPERTKRDSGEARLVELTRRIEAALENLAPRKAVEQLGERFTSLEGEVTRAVSQLERLDGIEARLGVLGTRLTDEQIVALFGPLVPTAEDLTRFAEDAASRVADRVLAARAGEMSAPDRPKSSVDGPSGHQIKALSELLANFMDERRRSDSGTQEALETLQLAMQHVLDKMEHAGPEQERGTSGAGLSPEPHEMAPAEAAESRYAAPERMPGEMQGPGSFAHELDFRPAPEPQWRAALAGSTPSDLAPDRGHYTPQERMPEPPPVAPLAGGPPRHAPAPADVPRQTIYEPSPFPQAPAEGNPRALIAMARRAAEKAKAEAARQPGSKADKPAKAKSFAFGGLLLGGEAGKAVAGVRPGVLIVTSLAAFLLAGYWLLSSPKDGIPGAAAPSAIERSEAPSSQPPPGGEQSAPATEGEPKAVKPAPVEQAPQGAPKQILDEEPSAPPAVDRLEAKLDASPARSAGPGMAVVIAGQQATIDQVMQARERARLASLSQRAGFTAAHSYSAPPDASPVVTASLQAAPAPAGPAAAPAASSRQIALPPAAAGPLSLRLAAAQGDASAQLEIATRLAEGKGVKQSFSEAAQWFQRAAAQGQAVAQYRLATLYERGMGVKPDREQARALYRQAADGGNVSAMIKLAVMSLNSTDGAPDYATAVTLFSKAANHGLIDSQYNLGVIYQRGMGVPKDHAAAYKWFALAARGGDAQAAGARDFLLSRLPAETIAATNAQIASWQPTPVDERANDARIAGEAWKQRTADARH